MLWNIKKNHGFVEIDAKVRTDKNWWALEKGVAKWRKWED